MTVQLLTLTLVTRLSLCILKNYNKINYNEIKQKLLISIVLSILLQFNIVYLDHLSL